MRLFFSALLFSLPMLSIGQENHESKQKDHGPLLLFIEPSALLSGYNNESFRAGLEIPVWKNMSVTGTGCYYTDGFGFKAGLKVYLDNEVVSRRGLFRKKDQRVFIGADYFYKSYSYTNNDVLSADHNTTVGWHVDKRASTLSFFSGKLTTLNCGLSYEWFAGLGIRLKTVHNDLEPDETDGFYHWHEGFVTSFTDAAASNQLGLHIALGFKIGWRIR